MKKQTSKLSVYSYTDYYQKQKERIKALSYRNFARNAGINSVGIYRDVVEGRQKLGRALVLKLTAPISHTKKEAEYFESLVFFNKARSSEERKLFCERMLTHQSAGTKSSIVDETRYNEMVKVIQLKK